MTTLMHPQLFCSVIESIINQAISMSPGSAPIVTKLGEASLLIELAELGFAMVIRQNQQKLLITSPSDQFSDADCAIYTSLSTLNELKSEYQLTELIKQEKLDIQGDLKVAQQFAAIADSITIDWQAELEKHIGDIATYKLVSLAKEVKNKADFVRSQISADASEYLVHEKKWIVTKPELDVFTQEVKQCQQTFNDLESKLTKLSQQITQFK